METAPFALRGEFITLAALLKASGLAGSGGSAKALATGGDVRVNGQTETRRGRKLRAGDEVAVGDARIRVQAAA
jgi:ribosome-associated protein